MRRFLLFTLFMIAMIPAAAQGVKWQASCQKVSKGVYDIVIKASVPSGYHLYDMGPYDSDGPLATTVSVEGVQVDGAVKASAAKRYNDPMYGMEIGIYEGQATFVQRVKAKARTEATVKVSGMICSGENCMPPKQQTLKVILK